MEFSRFVPKFKVATVLFCARVFGLQINCVLKQRKKYIPYIWTVQKALDDTNFGKE